MQITEKEKLKRSLKLDEGFSSNPYFCPTGRLTIGWGRNLEANPLTAEERELGLRKGFKSKEFLEKLLDNDVEKVIRAMDQYFPWHKNLDSVRQRGLANMIFQMGTWGVLGFKNSMKLLQEGNYYNLEQNLRESKWYGQTTARAGRVILQLARGEDPPRDREG